MHAHICACMGGGEGGVIWYVHICILINTLKLGIYVGDAMKEFDGF